MEKCDVCGIEFEEWDNDIFDLCEECASVLKNEVDWIRENISEDFAK